MGAKTFVDLCHRLQARHGDRFAPPSILIEMAASESTFYGLSRARMAA
jgi:3-hydroxyacyl-CoA dehydrogenase/enoyl-CoA hydratase/3-hydroxybutyryl-CoA epimerase